MSAAIGKWTQDPRPMRRRFLRDRIVIAVVSALVAILVLAILSPVLWLVLLFAGNWTDGVAFWVGLLLVALPVIPVLISVCRRMSEHMLCLRDAGSTERTLLEDPTDPYIALVEAVIMDASRRVGVDRGVIWVAEGLLHFRGTATYFALPGAEFDLARTGTFSVLLVLVSRLKLKLYPLRAGDKTLTRFARVVESAIVLVRRRSTSTEPVILPPNQPWRQSV